MEADTIFVAIKAAQHKRFLFGYKKLYRPIAPHDERELQQLEVEGRFQFPAEVRSALLALGSCAVEELYIHAKNDIYRFDNKNGPMSGYVSFASDVLGNYFAFNPESNSPAQIFYYSHDPVGWALVAPDFLSYLNQFVKAGFDTLKITEPLELNEC